MAETTTPKAKAPATSPPDDFASLRALIDQQGAQNAELRASLEAVSAELVNLQKLHATERPVTLPQVMEFERQEWFKKFHAQHSRSVKERSQENADRLWAHETRERYRVSVADVPELLIPARSPQEAKGRYDELCGIRSVDLDRHSYKVERVTTAAA